MVIVVRSIVAELEVEYAYHIDGFQLIIPFALETLLTDWESGVIDAPVLEVLLLAALHLHKYLLATLILAIYIEHGAAVTFRRTQMLGVEIIKVAYHFLAAKQAVDETYQKFLVYFRAEKHLETEVGIRIDISVACETVFNHSSMC